MRLVALDLETTGLDPQKDQILQIGMLCFESITGEVIGEFETLVSHARYEGDAYALQMNHKLLKRLAAGEGANIASARSLMAYQLRVWGFDIGDRKSKPVAVGFNVAPFDLAFLKASRIDLFSHRAVELGTLLMHVFKDCQPVTSNAYMEARGLEVTHTALEDCRMARDAYLDAMKP